MIAGRDTILTPPHILLASNRSQRSLQRLVPNITTIYYTPETDAPTSSPTRMARWTRLMVCTAVSKNAVSVPTDVDFYFRLETNSNVSAATANMVASVSGAAINAIASSICLNSDKRSRHRELKLAKGCLVSISAGADDDTRIVGCTPEKKQSRSCAWYRGSLRLLHTDACSGGAVTSAVLSALSTVNVSEFLTLVNANNQDVNVTHVTFAEVPGSSSSSGTAVTSKSAERSNQVTVGGFVVLMITGWTLLLAVYLLVRACRRRTIATSKQAQMAAHDADKADADRTFRMTDDGSYIGPDWGNIGGSHSSVDSHRCNSATCTVCHGGGGLEGNGVRILEVDQNTEPNVYLEGLRSFSDDEEDDDDQGDKEPTRRRGGGGARDRGGMRIHGLAKDANEPAGSRKERDDYGGDEDSYVHDNFEVTLDEQNLSVDAGTIGNEKVRFVRFFGWARSRTTSENKSLEL
jgi:hypothetical protein